MFLKDLFFPKFCLGCLYLGSYICPNCQKKLLYVKKESCFYCQKPSPYGLTHFHCQKKDGIDGIMAVFYYNSLLRKIIKNTKYQRATKVLQELFQITSSNFIEKFLFFKDFKNIYLQPVPLHPKKERERGFNQADLIISFFKKILPFPTASFLLRKKETQPQAQIKNKKERYLNIKGAFAIKPGIKIKPETKIVLVDDVLTSGFTLIEAAKTLKKAGVKEVFALTLAKSH